MGYLQTTGQEQAKEGARTLLMHGELLLYLLMELSVSEQVNTLFLPTCLYDAWRLQDLQLSLVNFVSVIERIDYLRGNKIPW